ncbi:MAG: helicase-related protein [Candidatus Izemoplasmatales bacterium]|nr:helicase-related protein [Candidatus Izemoplasmatales bacterium]
MEVFDNKTKLLGDDLRKEIIPGSKVKIVASFFSIYAYETLKEELESVEELEFIFSAPTFVSESIKGTVKKEAKEFYIPKQLRESSLYGTEFEVRLRNQLTQRVIAKECAQWIKSKVKFKSNITAGGIQNFIYVDNNEKKIAYTPIEGFTAVDLGYEHNNMHFQGIMKQDEELYSSYFFNQFKTLWNDDNKMEDVTDAIVDYIATAYKENSPEFIYFITLYNIFAEFLQESMFEDTFPNELTGYQNSLIWNKLYSFQKDGAIGIINKLEKYNGCILADSVGLGKTFTALAVMKYYSSRNKNILVLTPKKLADNWNRYKNNTKTNIFFNDHIRFDVLYHTDLGRTRGYSNGINLQNFNWDNYDLVVIDESHNFRNNAPFRNRETRYSFLLNKVLKSGVKSKVLMLSATPVNNRFTDLKNQIALAYGDDPKGFNEKLDTKNSVSEILRQAQRAFNEWAKLPKSERNAKELMKSLDLDFSILLDNVTIARSRKHVTKYYDISEVGDFPKRLEPISFYTNIARSEDSIDYKTIYEELMNLRMGVYAPTLYIQPSKLSKYEELYDTDVLGKPTLRQFNREKALQRLMTINMLKRLESSVDSFRITIQNVKSASVKTMELIEKFELSDRNDYVQEFDNIVVDDFDDEDFDDYENQTIGKIKIDFRDMDLRRYKADLEYDISALETLYDIMSYITPEKDLKLQKLIQEVSKKIENPINEGNKKVLIFSAFADTTNYLYKHLAKYVKEKYGLESAKIQGDNSGNATTIKGSKDTDRLLTMFSPVAKERDLVYQDEKYDIDLLIATDCISEGQNLQDCDTCINYDIHWNPVRIVQRFGRIDRIGSINKQIQLMNFWPNISLDEYIKLNSRVENRMVLVDATATADDNILSQEESDLDYRAAQLKKLQEGTLQDLEDVDGQITITDLGLNEFKMDMIQYIKTHGEPSNIPNGMYAVVKENLEKNIQKGTIFVLRNRNDDINIEKQNRLHPYYLLYIREDGEVLVNHTDPKLILDILRTTCKHQIEPIKELTDLMNKETNDGYKMDKYSKLLQDAVAAIVKKEEQNDLSSIFKKGSNVLFDKSISGLDDFELITFVVVK